MSREALSLRERWRLRLLAWRLPRLLRRRPLLQVLERLTPPRVPARGSPRGSAQAIASAAQRILSRPLRMRGRRCLREGLLAYHALRSAGHPAVLHFGVLRGSQRLERLKAHCWVSLGGVVLTNAPEDDYAELLVYDGQARALRAAGPADPAQALAGLAF